MDGSSTGTVTLIVMQDMRGGESSKVNTRRRSKENEEYQTLLPVLTRTMRKNRSQK